MRRCIISRLIPLFIPCFLLAACSAESSNGNHTLAGAATQKTLPSTGGMGTGEAGGNSVTVVYDGGIPYQEPRTGTIEEYQPDAKMNDGTGACTSIGKSAETSLAPVDIVWVVDGSGSMFDEAQRIQQNIDNFVSEISASGVDTRVVIIARQDLVPADSNLAISGNYRYVRGDVDSWNSLDRLTAQFNDYEDFLRPNAHVHFIVVTDDESGYMGLPSPDERANQFQKDIDSMLEASFSVHAIASEGNVGDLPCSPNQELMQCCSDFLMAGFVSIPPGCEEYEQQIMDLFTCISIGGAAAPGVTYYTLAKNTSGVAVSICKEDWTDVFGSLEDAVVQSAPLPCNYEIPEPPNGLLLDTEMVNVKYTPQGVDPLSVDPYPRATDAASCGDREAWYFDNAEEPLEVLLCPSACEQVASGQGGAVEVLFGCATIVVE